MDIHYANIIIIFILPLIIGYKFANKNIFGGILNGFVLMMVNSLALLSFESLPNSGKKILTLFTNNTEYKVEGLSYSCERIKSHGKYKRVCKPVVFFSTKSNKNISKETDYSFITNDNKIIYNEFTDMIIKYDLWFFTSILLNLIFCYFFMFYSIYATQIIFGWKTTKTKFIFKKTTISLFPFLKGIL